MTLKIYQCPNGYWNGNSFVGKPTKRGDYLTDQVPPSDDVLVAFPDGQGGWVLRNKPVPRVVVPERKTVYSKQEFDLLFTNEERDKRNQALAQAGRRNSLATPTVTALETILLRADEQSKYDDVVRLDSPALVKILGLWVALGIILSERIPDILAGKRPPKPEETPQA